MNDVIFITKLLRKKTTNLSFNPLVALICDVFHVLYLLIC